VRSRRQQLRSVVAPFAGISALALAATSLHVSDTNWTLVAAAGLVAVLVAGSASAAPYARFLVAPLPVLPIALDGVLALLRQAQGGTTSGYGPLVILPVVWVGLAGSRRSVLAMTGCTALVFAAPILLLGGPLYPVLGWRAALLWTVVAAVVGSVILRVVERERHSGALARNRSVGLDRLVESQAALATNDLDTRGVLGLIASSALTVADADAACVQLLDGDELVCRGVAGTATDFLGRGYPAADSLAGACIRDGQTVICTDSESDARVARETCRAVGARTLIMVPLRDADEVKAVLIVWSATPHDFRGFEQQLLAVLANASAAALVRAELVDQLSRQASTDELTGLPNRRSWKEKLDEAIARSARQGSPLSVLLLDLDGFKAVNDTWGHAAGDDLLERVCAAWNLAVRETDTLGRLGGDEFAIILEAADEADARRVIGRVEAATPEDIGASVGLAVWDRQETAGGLLARADEQMYRHKVSKEGRSVRQLVGKSG
jgi:diguanylate cyclase (GGDEF)-like protein